MFVWQSGDTAPKDCQPFLAITPDGLYLVAKWSEPDNSFKAASPSYFLTTVKYWMPLPPAPGKPHQDRMLSCSEVARVLGLGVAAVRLWSRTNRGPPMYRFGKRVRYRESDLEAWLEEMKLKKYSRNYRRLDK